MATPAQLSEALRRADAAGDTQAATRLAKLYQESLVTTRKAVLQDTGQGRLSSFGSNVGRGALSVIPGSIGGLGYLTGSDTLTETAEGIEGGINRALPVNPLYQGEFVQKAGQAIGQAGGTMATAGVGGAVGKGLSLARGVPAAGAISLGAKTTALGGGALQGVREGGQAAERYGMTGGTAYARALLGGVTELGTEMLPFGTLAETGAARRLLGEALDKGLGGLAKTAGTEAAEEVAANTLGNVATRALAPEGVATPGILEGNLEAGALGAVGGATFAGVNALTPSGQPAPEAPVVPEDEFVTVESGGMQAFVPDPGLEESVAALTAEDVEDPLLTQTVETAVASVVDNQDVLPATAQALEEIANEPIETPPEPEQPVPVAETPQSTVIETPPEPEVVAEIPPTSETPPHTPDETSQEISPQDQIQEAGGPAPVESLPPEQAPAVEAEEGTAQRQGEGQEEIASPAPEQQPAPAAPAAPPAPTRRPQAAERVQFRREGNLITGVYKGQDNLGRHVVDVNGQTEYVAKVPVPLEDSPITSISFRTTPVEQPAVAEATETVEEEEPPVAQAIAAPEQEAMRVLRDSNANLSPAAQAKWTPAAYQAAESYFVSGDMADLAPLTTVQRRRAVQARLDVDEAARVEQEKIDRREEQRISKRDKKDRDFESRTTFLSADQMATGERGAQGITEEEAKAIVADFKSKLVAPVAVEVVSGENLGTAPEFQSLRDAADRAGASVEDVGGWFDRTTGTAYIVFDQVRDAAHVRRVLIHEIVTHGGVGAVATTEEMRKIASIIKRVAPEINDFVEDNYPDARAETKIEEMLAKFSEQYRSADPANLREGWAKAWEDIKRILAAVIKRLGGDINAFDDLTLHRFYTNAVRNVSRNGVRRGRNGGVRASVEPSADELRLSVEDQFAINQANFPGTPEAREAVRQEEELDDKITVESEARFQSWDERNNRFIPVSDKTIRSDADAFLDSMPLDEAFTRVMAEDVPGSLARGADGRYNLLLSGLLRRLTTAMDLTQDPYKVAQFRVQQKQAAQRFQEVGTGEGRALRSRAVANADIAPIAPILAAEKVLTDRSASTVNARFEGGEVAATDKLKKVNETASAQASEDLSEELTSEDDEVELSEAELLRQKSQATAERIFQSLVRPDEPVTKMVNPVREVYKQHLKDPMEKAAFVAKMTSLGVEPTLADTLYQTSMDEIQGRETTARLREKKKEDTRKAKILSKDSPQLVKMINALRQKLYPGLNWKQIFEDLPDQQRERQKKIFTRLRLDERLKGLTQQEALDLTNELDKAWQRQRRRVFLKELERKGVLGEKAPADKAKVEKALPQLIRAINLGTFNSEMFREIIGQEYGFRQLTSAQARDLRQQAQEAWLQPEGVLRNQKMGKLLDSLQKDTGSTVSELVNNFWVASVLSGLATQFDTYMSTLNGMGNNLIQAGTLIARGKGKEAFKAHLQWWAGLKQGALESLQILAKPLGEGDYSVLKRFTTDLNKALEGQSNFRPVPLGESLWRNGNVWQKYGMAPVMMFTGRLMSAADHINNTATTYGAMAVARALHPEIYGNLSSFTAEERKNARAQAIKEVTGGAEPTTREEKATVSVRTREILGGALTPEQQEEASFIGDQAAYQNDPIGLFGSVYEALNAGVGTVERKLEKLATDPDTGSAFARGVYGVLAGGLRGITGTKFMRFGFNFGNDITQYIPGSYLLQKLALPIYGKEMSRSQQELLLGKNIFGLMTAATLAAMFLEKDDEEEGWHIEGNWSGLTPGQKKQLRTEGKEPLTMWKRAADGTMERISYRSWPLSGIFVSVGSMNDQKRYDPKQWEKTGLAGHLMRAVTNGALQVKDITAMQGIAELFGASSFNTDPESDFIDRLLKLPIKFEGGFIPTLLKDIDAWEDPRNFKPETSLDELMRSVPILRRQVADGRAMLNLLGEEVQMSRTPWRRVYSEAKGGKAYEVLGQLLSRGLSLPEPSSKRVVRYQGVEQTIEAIGPEAEWQFAKILGGKYKKFLENEGEALTGMTLERAQKRLRARAQDIGDQAERELVTTLSKAQ